MAMAPATYSLTPVHPHVGVEVVEVDLSVPLRRRHVPGDFRRVPRVVGPGLPRPGPHRLAGRLQRALRSPRGDDQEPGELGRLPEGDRRTSRTSTGRRVDPPDDLRMIHHSGNQLWPSDSSFKRVPTLASFLSGRAVPPAGGETEFARPTTGWTTRPVGGPTGSLTCTTLSTRAAWWRRVSSRPSSGPRSRRSGRPSCERIRSTGGRPFSSGRTCARSWAC
jgi:hypothetical protein